MAGRTLDIFERDTLLLNYMKQHKGIDNIVSSYEVQKYLAKNGYNVKRIYIGTILNKIMYERNAPICYKNGKGYYWATSRVEIEQTISDMESRRNSLQEHIDHLKNFIIE